MLRRDVLNLNRVSMLVFVQGRSLIPNAIQIILNIDIWWQVLYLK